MIQQQALQRYYSRDKLQRFLKNKFGDNINFNIQRAGEEYLTFEAPELLTAVSRPERLATLPRYADIIRMTGGNTMRPLLSRPVNANERHSTSDAKD